ncbi:MAG TPA: hypothetical protein DDW30_02510 [Clostridiales bacterium]|nr:hypothetical protein [Clostridiales bacterium]
MNFMMQAKAEGNLTKILLPSVLSILLCLVLLCGMTWAWFTSTQSAPAATIMSATYNIDIVAKNGETELSGQNGTYTLMAGVEYTVTLTASGTAKTGYCKMTLPNGTSLFTDQIGIGEENAFSFKLMLEAGGEVRFSPQWGTCTQDDIADIKRDNTIVNGSIQK